MPSASLPDSDSTTHPHQQHQQHRDAETESIGSPTVARLVRIKHYSTRALPPIPAAIVSAPSSHNDKLSPLPPPPSSSSFSHSLSSIQQFSREIKPGIVRSKRPQPLNIERRRSIASIGRHVQRMTSSVLGKALRVYHNKPYSLKLICILICAL